MADIRSKGVAFEREINITTTATQIKTLRFVGGTVGETILIVGSEDFAVAQKLYGEMMRINNEQTNALRTVLKEQSRGDNMYNELSYLNNELVVMQREIAKKNAELERLNREKNHFLGMAAHDLRSPLHTILGYSDLLIRISDQPAQQEYLQVIFNATLFMARLIDDLLDVTKIEGGNLQLEYDTVNLASLITSNAAVNRSIAAHKQIELIYQLDETVPKAVVDSAKIEQVLNNLISNAIKFSEPENKVVIRLERAEENFLISVKDDGRGITSEHQSHLFQPFQQGQTGTDGEKSTGLGLAIVKRIVERHGGKIWFESKLEQGTTFFVSIPLRPQDDQRFS
ncbi:MAG: HAMP domain-containing histidine kinase [Chloroflexi bacterium]|nr:HAMP domain-containing histidine kinase [Chloroflexota bacterium]